MSPDTVLEPAPNVSNGQILAPFESFSRAFSIPRLIERERERERVIHVHVDSHCGCPSATMSNLFWVDGASMAPLYQA